VEFSHSNTASSLLLLRTTDDSLFLTLRVISCEGGRCSSRGSKLLHCSQTCETFLC